MFALERLKYSKIADVALGNIMLCHSWSRMELALRIEIPNAAPEDSAGALSLPCLTSWNQVGSVVFGDLGQKNCVDLGVPRFALDADSIADGVAQQVYDVRPAMIAVSGQDLVIFAANDVHATSHAWWSVRNGKQVNAEERLLIDRWCVGLDNIDGKFTSQLKFPGDFRSPS